MRKTGATASTGCASTEFVQVKQEQLNATIVHGPYECHTVTGGTRVGPCSLIFR